VAIAGAAVNPKLQIKWIRRQIERELDRDLCNRLRFYTANRERVGELVRGFNPDLLHACACRWRVTWARMRVIRGRCTSAGATI